MKISKFQNNQQTNLSEELHNHDLSFLMKIRRSKVKPCQALPKKKIYIFVCFCFHFCLIFWKNNHFENYTHFIYLIKGTVLGRALQGC